MANRTGRGWFQPGHPKFGTGRPQRSKVERAHVIQMFRDNVSDDELRAIINKNKRDALGVRMVTLPDGTQRVEDDPNSDPRARVQARQQLYEYLMGRPPQPLEIDETENTQSVLDQFTNEELEAFIMYSTNKTLSGEHDRTEVVGPMERDWKTSGTEQSNVAGRVI